MAVATYTETAQSGFHTSFHTIKTARWIINSFFSLPAKSLSKYAQINLLYLRQCWLVFHLQVHLLRAENMFWVLVKQCEKAVLRVAADIITNSKLLVSLLILLVKRKKKQNICISITVCSLFSLKRCLPRVPMRIHSIFSLTTKNK